MTPQGFLVPSYMVPQTTVPSTSVLSGQQLQAYPQTSNIGQAFGYPTQAIPTQQLPIAGGVSLQQQQVPSPPFPPVDKQSTPIVKNPAEQGENGSLIDPRRKSDRGSSRVSPLLSNGPNIEHSSTIAGAQIKPEVPTASRNEPEWMVSHEQPHRDFKESTDKGRYNRDQKDRDFGKPFRKDFNRYGDKKFKKDYHERNNHQNNRGGHHTYRREFKAKESANENSPKPSKHPESDNDKILKLLKEAKGIESNPEPVKPVSNKDEGTFQANKWKQKNHKARKFSRSRSRSLTKNKPKEDISSSSKKRIELLNKRFDMLFQKKKDESEEENYEENKSDLSPRSPDESDNDFRA